MIPMQITGDTEESSDYSGINGLEGNGQASELSISDSEDLDKDYSLDNVNDYFTISLYPTDNFSPYKVTETEADGVPAGWKLFRVPLAKFEKRGEGSVVWTDVRACVFG